MEYEGLTYKLNVIKLFLQKKLIEINANGRGGNDAIAVGEIIDDAIEVVEKQEKYKWHDLRKNPNDLPGEEAINSSIDVWIATIDEEGDIEQYKGFLECGHWWTQWCHGCHLIAEDVEVIAWKYIEPFMEEE